VVYLKDRNFEGRFYPEEAIGNWYNPIPPLFSILDTI
jgi:hypothetical protein